MLQQQGVGSLPASTTYGSGQLPALRQRRSTLPSRLARRYDSIISPFTPPPARITSSALSQTCLRVPQWALCFLSRECLSAHASRCPFFWHQSFRRRRPRRRAAAANFAAADDADVVALTTIALALATPPLWKAATAADTADADAAPTTITVAAAGRGVRLPLRGAGLQLVLENAAIWRVLRLSGESIPFISIGQPAVHAARGRSLF